MRRIILLVAFFSIKFLNSQDLSGTWEGTYGDGDYVKLVMIKTGDHYSGYTYDEGMGYCKANFKGLFNQYTKKLKGRGDGMIEKTFWHSQCVYNMTYFTYDNTEILSGLVWPKSVAVKVLSLGIPVNIHLKRTSQTIDSTPYIQKQLAAARVIGSESEKTDTALAVMAEFDKIEDEVITIKQERAADTIQTIFVSSRKINFKIFDNGISDGDSVSIIYNNQLLTAGLIVTAKPFELEVDLQPGINVHTITLVAHNLGTIPPNTATILIESGEKVYRLSASSDFKKNAVIIIRSEE